MSVPALLLVAVLVIYPIGLLANGALSTDGRQMLETLTADSVERQALLRTVWVSTVVALAATGLGSVFAWSMCVIRSRVGLVVLWVSVLAPFWMSVVVKNYAFILLLREGGPISDLLVTVRLLGPEDSLLYSETAVVIGMLYAMLPYAVLPMFAALSSIDKTLLQAAEAAGASRIRSIIDVVVPLSSRAALSTFTLVFVISLGFYVTPVILGGPGKPFLATLAGSHIFDTYNLDGAKALASTLLVLALAAAVVSQLVSRMLPEGRQR
jgi:putative spermidine/putrescine transport system permease protein